MEKSNYAFTYKGSIPDAISESQKQKKLFVVHISGEDEDSIRLEQSTWVDQSVAETISRCCIFLHLTDGSVDAAQFSAIYPQKSIPSISAVGLNGVLLWQHEGYISTEDFTGSIEKAWAALHLQETAVTFFTAALASRKPELPSSSSQSVTSSQTVAPSVQGISSGSDVLPTLADKLTECSDQLTDSRQSVKQKTSEPSDDKDSKPGEENCLQSDNVDRAEIINRGRQSSSDSGTGKQVVNSVSRNVNESSFCHGEGSSADPEGNPGLDESNTTASPESAGRSGNYLREKKMAGSSQMTANDAEEKTQVEKVDGLTGCSNAVKSNDVHLSIRMPNGTSIQTKCTLAESLGSVKSFVDENQISGVGSYDLAIPYPRRLFNERDMARKLSELGFASRQALIVVPHLQPTRQSSPYDSHSTVSGADSSNPGEGYFGYVKRILSYVNPFSYFGGNAGSSSAEQAPNDGFWQYHPNPALRSHLPGSQTSRSSHSPNRQNTQGDSTSTARRTSRPFGSNIHTLRRDEDGGPYSDRNIFWNGNSTQYGGDDKK